MSSTQRKASTLHPDPSAEAAAETLAQLRFLWHKKKKKNPQRLRADASGQTTPQCFTLQFCFQVTKEPAVGLWTRAAPSLCFRGGAGCSIIRPVVISLLMLTLEASHTCNNKGGSANTHLGQSQRGHTAHCTLDFSLLRKLEPHKRVFKKRGQTKRSEKMCAETLKWVSTCCLIIPALSRLCRWR